MRSFTLTMVCILLCACNDVDFGARSYTGRAPLVVEDKQIGPGAYYIEVLGNGFSSRDMLSRFFADRARTLCGGEPKHISVQQGRLYPNARLPRVRDRNPGCFEDGGFCQGSVAIFPLVFGEVYCTDSAVAAQHT